MNGFSGYEATNAVAGAVRAAGGPTARDEGVRTRTGGDGSGGGASAARSVLARAMSEADLQASVLDLLGRHGWLAFHASTAATVRRGAVVHRTAQLGDRGFPDIAATSGKMTMTKRGRQGAVNTWRPLTHRPEATGWGLAVEATRKTCSIEDCERVHAARGYCIKHYKRWWKHEDPSVVLPPPGHPGVTGSAHPGWRGDDVSYKAMHERVAKQHGRANTHLCACGSRAVHWSYTYSDPNPKYSAEGFPYSLDADRYVPRCRSCHTSLDRWGKPDRANCIHGHELAPANTRNGDGTGGCLTCEREQAQARKSVCR